MQHVSLVGSEQVTPIVKVEQVALVAMAGMTIRDAENPRTTNITPSIKKPPASGMF